MLSLAMPWLLLLLPLPWLVRRILPISQHHYNALRIPLFTELKTLALQSDSIKGKLFKKIVAFIIWTLLVIAASGPQWLGEPIHIPQQGRNIMMAIDISGSMQLPDMVLNNKEVNRLQAVKQVANEFIEQRKNDRIGLILFGSRAYLQTPLTYDLSTVQSMLNDASIGLAGPQTAIGDAIGLGIKRLLAAPSQSRVLILLTDGGNNSGTVSPLTAAELAAKNNIRIYTIGVGAEEIRVPGIFGAEIINPSADLDEDTLQKIADLTQGQYFRAKDTTGLQQIYRAINKLEPVNNEALLFRPIKPLYPWPLGIALGLSFLIAFYWIGKSWRLSAS